jgi:integrase
MSRRTLHRLSAKGLDALAKKPGMHPDGGNLYFQVTPARVTSWTLRYMLDRRVRYMGLGPWPLISLSEARKRAAECRRQKLDGIDPLEARRAERRKKKVEAARAMTFEACAEAYAKAHAAGWRSLRHTREWSRSLDTHVFPVFGDLPVEAIDVALVRKALEKIWLTTPETASRVRGRVEAVLDFAKAAGYRDGENPARWKGHLDQLLPARRKVRKVEHFAALPWQQVPQFVAELRQRDSIAARCLEFLILNASRAGEALGARWDEVDLDERTWAIPGTRMKSGRPHVVPLADPALRILKTMAEIRDGSGFVFPGRPGAALTHSALLRLLERMGRRGDITVHGFRSAFTDWGHESTRFARETVEMALAHAIEDKTEEAYRRGSQLEKRRLMMAAWAKFCSTPPRSAGEVVAIGGAR